MAKKNIVSIGMEIPGADIKTISLKSKSSPQLIHEADLKTKMASGFLL